MTERQHSSPHALEQQQPSDRKSSHSKQHPGDDVDEDASSISSRSDQDEEAAGLVSRMSSERDRSSRRNRYEGIGSNRTLRASQRAKAQDGDEDDEDEEDSLRRSVLGDRRVASVGGEGGDHYTDSLHSGGYLHTGGRGFADRSETAGRIGKLSVFRDIKDISKEALPTLVLSLFSLMFSGELLVHLARWPVFIKCDKLFILTPILLNLKGNLEGNLSLRMSTSANIGELDIRRTRHTLIKGNLALLQVQALIVSSFAGVLAFVLGVLMPEPPPSSEHRKPLSDTSPAAPLMRVATVAMQRILRTSNRRGGFPASSSLTRRRIIHHHPKPLPVDPALKLRNGYFEFVLVLATGMLSASLSSAILGSFMCALVVVTRRMGGNPDNIASPLAASLGDLLTLTLLGLLGSFLIRFEGSFLATVILIGLIVACAVCFLATWRNAYVRELLSSGWVPLLVAMFISSGAGLVLDSFVQRYEGFALLAPVVTGLPGACAAIFTSRISTCLHSGVSEHPPKPSAASGTHRGKSSPGILARLGFHDAQLTHLTEGWVVPLTLLLIALLINITFLLFLYLTSQLSFGWPFAISFMLVSSTATSGALALAHTFCRLLWARDFDPDIYCLPFVSSLVDVLGQTLLVAAFTIAALMGDHVTAAIGAGDGHGGS